jgi:hypothetical protein
MIAHNPLHGSGRAAFPLPALALGNNADAPQRIRMIKRQDGVCPVQVSQDSQ